MYLHANSYSKRIKKHLYLTSDQNNLNNETLYPDTQIMKQ